MKRIVRIGTRGSQLALWQADWIKSKIEERHKGIDIALIRIKTTGDKILDVPLAKVGGKGLFVKEIEEKLLHGEIDLAVHSMKDLPTELPEGLYISAITQREDPRDALITKVQSSKLKVQSFKDLPQGAIVGTSSLRRQCQLKALRPDLNITNLRGNLDTRIKKLDKGQFDAIIVASAGVKRLGLENRITEYLLPEISLPAIGQGALGIESRMDDTYIAELVHFLNHEETAICIRAERAFLKRLEGGCQVPIAAYARMIERRDERQETSINKLSLLTGHWSLLMDGLVGSISGDRIVRGSLQGKPEESEAIGIRLAEDLLSRGAKEILDEVYGKNVN